MKSGSNSPTTETRPQNSSVRAPPHWTGSLPEGSSNQTAPHEDRFTHWKKSFDIYPLVKKRTYGLIEAKGPKSIAPSYQIATNPITVSQLIQMEVPNDRPPSTLLGAVRRPTRVQPTPRLPHSVRKTNTVFFPKKLATCPFADAVPECKGFFV
jgi:hypothetical protein